MTDNPYRPVPAKITSLTPETDLEFTLTVEASADMTPGQFFQVSLPKIGEAPLSISAFGSDWIQFTVRAVGGFCALDLLGLLAVVAIVLHLLVTWWAR